MGVIKNFFSGFIPKEKPVQTPFPENKLTKSLDKNIEFLKEKFHGSADFTLRSLAVNNVRCAVISIEGMVDKENLAVSIVNPLMQTKLPNLSPMDLLTHIERSVLGATDIVRVPTFEKAFALMMAGFAVFVLDGTNEMLAIGVQGFNVRSIEEPETEIVQKGSREGFVEPLRINMSLLRRRIKNPVMKFETMTLGKTSKTEICLCYLTDRVSSDVLKELRKRLSKIDIDVVLGSGYLVQYLEDENDRSMFKGVGSSERPDTVAGKISEGRIAIIVDGTPVVLIVPYLFVENFQTMDDYTNRPFFATFSRWLKYISFFVAMLTPGLYVAVATFNTEIFPVEILTKVVTSISGTPFDLMTEVFMIHFIYEIMREAGLRLPRTLGHAISIIGALVVGETAVNAGLIGAPTLMVVAVTAVASYVIPILYGPLTILRFLFILIGGFFGIWGIVLLCCILAINICSKNSFGIPYASPLSPFNFFGMRDVLVRSGWKTLSAKRNLVQNQSKGSINSEENYRE